LYYNPDDIRRRNSKLPSVFEEYVSYLEKNLLELEINGLSPVTAQIALIELRNVFFNQIDKNDEFFNKYCKNNEFIWENKNITINAIVEVGLNEWMNNKKWQLMVMDYEIVNQIDNDRYDW